MNLISGIGVLAATLTTLSFSMQVMKTWKTKSTRDVSLEMFVIFCSGVLLWVIYGVLVKDLLILLANFVTLTLGSMIVGLKLKYG